MQEIYREDPNNRIYRSIQKELEIREFGQLWKKRQNEELEFLKEHGVVSAFKEVANIMRKDTKLVVDLTKPSSKRAQTIVLGLFWNFKPKEPGNFPFGMCECNFVECYVAKAILDGMPGLAFRGSPAVIKPEAALIRSRLIEIIEQPLTTERYVGARMALRLAASSIGWI